MHILQYIITSFLFTIPCAHAMDLEMVTVKPRVPVELRIKNWPIELRAKVAENIIDLFMHEYENTKECIDHNKCERWNLSKLLLKIEYAQEFYQLQKICEREICGKKFLAQELFILPRQERDVFLRMKDRSILQLMAEGDMSINDYEIFERMENESIKKGLKVRLQHGNKIVSYMEVIGFGSTCLSGLLLCIAMIINSKNGYLMNSVGISCLSGICLYGIAFLLRICGYSPDTIKGRF